MHPKIYKHQGSLELEQGGSLTNSHVAFHQWGKPRKDGSNVVWVCHALTANSNPFEWWEGLFGEGDFFNSEDWCIICANILGSCYGTTGPLSSNAETGETYYSSFPSLTIRDLVNAHRLLAEHLGIDRIGILIGGSLGGQQALEWAVQEPERFDTLIPIATNAVHSPWGIAFNESQRLAIQTDPTWGEHSEEAGKDGMKVARGIALLSYRNYGRYTSSQSRERDQVDSFKASTYQIYQGVKLARRFNAYSYHLLSRVMDSHDLGRSRRSIEHALASIQARTLVISLEGDLLFPEEEQMRIANGIPGAGYIKVASKHGHDGFLIETDSLAKAISRFLRGENHREFIQELNTIQK
jgi:homoserine O-acetyltransferase